MEKTISIVQALNELKLYDSKIIKAIDTTVIIGAAKKADKKVGVILKPDFESRVKANYQSVNDLIRNRKDLKSAIVQSNANTLLEVAGERMTVAQAIERKESISYEKRLLQEMKIQYNETSKKVLSENAKVDSQVDRLLEAFIGKESDKKANKEDQAAITEPYREKNEFELINPLNILTEIDALETKILNFESNVNTSLVLSNATTFIVVNV